MYGPHGRFMARVGGSNPGIGQPPSSGATPTTPASALGAATPASPPVMSSAAPSTPAASPWETWKSSMGAWRDQRPQPNFADWGSQMQTWAQSRPADMSDSAARQSWMQSRPDLIGGYKDQFRTWRDARPERPEGPRPDGFNMPRHGMGRGWGGWPFR